MLPGHSRRPAHTSAYKRRHRPRDTEADRRPLREVRQYRHPAIGRHGQCQPGSLPQARQPRLYLHLRLRCLRRRCEEGQRVLPPPGTATPPDQHRLRRLPQVRSHRHGSQGRARTLHRAADIQGRHHGQERRRADDARGRERRPHIRWHGQAHHSTVGLRLLCAALHIP